MKILAIETSCDETAAAVVEDGRVALSNVIASQVEEHRIYGGVVPEIASRRHSEAISGVVRQALADAQTGISDIDAVGVTYAPGLIGALLVGVNFAKGLAMSAGLPLVAVHHLRAHIAANYLAFPELEPPFLCLVVSGGHSHIVMVEDYTHFKVMGRTRDDAAGECYDKVARAMGMPYPGGVSLDRRAAQGNPNAFNLPRPRVEGSPYDFSFSGLKTAVINRLHNAEQKGELLNLDDLAASFQQTAVDMLIENTLLAAKDTSASAIVLAGGVSANSALRAQMSDNCSRLGIRLFYPPLSLCGDNAAMVGSQAFYEFGVNPAAGLDLNARATMPIDNSINN
ncbi:MAG: tRNA (adenosine(37)-N6)-threonylcarbamoyltransferase complex transferase subunit TsaD [Oscillospiraceae bacterium]|nr:tRNA (adenosine(37)-N6)-threonylcarbamoyltransferase complex transferase subunit TsaD [Oscillospiraceae bacterium]MDD4413007.1 tRNA (adenosine(37)-N6)-threonylcarbamoyltransferase complex transferase subunit TsaD [Oscillospiraceae bacterium]